MAAEMDARTTLASGRGALRAIAFQPVRRGSHTADTLRPKTALAMDRRRCMSPDLLSNTHLLSKSEWSGINVEPNRSGFSEFVWMRDPDFNLNVAVGSATGQFCVFWCSGPWSSLTKHRAEESGRTPTKVPVTSLQEIAESNNCLSPDLLNVDCEGHDLEVLRRADWRRFRPRCIVAEEDAVDSTGWLRQLVVSCGYLSHIRLGVSLIYVHSEHAIY